MNLATIPRGVAILNELFSMWSIFRCSGRDFDFLWEMAASVRIGSRFWDFSIRSPYTFPSLIHFDRFAPF